MGFAKCMATDNQSRSLGVVHSHATKGNTDIEGRLAGVGIAIRAFRVDVDEAMMSSSKRFLKGFGTMRSVGTAVIPDIVALGDKGGLRTPVDTLVGLPNIDTTTPKAESGEAHGLERNITGENHEVGPRDCLAVLLLDRPKETARFVEVAIVGPAVERSESLLALQVSSLY